MLKLSTPMRIAIKFVLNVLLVYAMNRFFPRYFAVFGGWPAFIVIGALLTLMNALVRPVLKLFALPIKLFATFLGIILVNVLFLWLTYRITLFMDPSLILMVINGGLSGWIIVSVTVGFANWVMKVVLK